MKARRWLLAAVLLLTLSGCDSPDDTTSGGWVDGGDGHKVWCVVGHGYSDVPTCDWEHRK